MTSQIPFTPLTPEAMARLTLDEQMAFEAATMTVARDQKPSLEVIATLVLAVQRLITEPSAAAAELAHLKRIHDREWRALWVMVRRSGGPVFIPEGVLAGIPPLASVGTALEPGGMRVNASEEP